LWALNFTSDLSMHGVPAGNKVEKLCDLCNITVNKNAVFGDSSALAPGGVRIGKKCHVKIILFFGVI
jgi:glycine/serine hydroxymethyltransferase